MNTTEIANFELNIATVRTLGFTVRLTRELAYIIIEYPRTSWEAELAIKEMMMAGATKAAIARKVRKIIGAFTAAEYRMIMEVVRF